MKSENNENDGRRNKFVIICAIFSFLLLGLVVLWNYRPEVESEFGPSNFYAGKSSEESNPLTLWALVHGSSLSGASACADKPISVSVYYVDGRVWLSSKSADLTKWDSVAGKLYDDGDYIIAPVSLEFINSNVSNSQDDITISAYVLPSKRFRLTWHKVDSWWCHIGKSNVTQHTKIYGYGGEYSQCTAGMVVGQAGDETWVTVEYKNEEGSWEAKSVKYFYEYVDEEDTKPTSTPTPTPTPK